ncbi:MAG: efflux RND transporter permease subunit [Bdellovibrionales bacterium]|nr:efflux RND transporter permease subunit [Bdellovibrionales bacterium]
MSLFETSIKKPVFAWMLMLALLLFGTISFFRLGVSQYPDVDFPTVSVSVDWEGAAPEVIETEVVDVVEEALLTVEGIKELYSTSRFGNGRVTAEFELSRNIDQAVQEVQTKIAQAQRNLPIDIEPPIVSKVNPEDRPIMWVGISGDRPLKELIEYVKNDVKDKFQTVPGVGEIILGGYVEPNIRVWMDPIKMRQFQITAEDIIEAIRNQHSEQPAGRLTMSTEERSVRIMGEAYSVPEIENLTISQRVRGGVVWKPFKLKDVARVEDGLDDIRRISRVNQQTALGLGIRKQRGTNAVAVAKGVKEKMEEIRPFLAKGVKLGINYDGTEVIEENIHELQLTLILATLFTSLVCWLFLGSFTSTLNVILAIPTSLGGAFTVMYFAGFTFNTITLLALSLVIGIVVDDAIVVLENIVRHREMGKSKFDAAFEGTREILFSVIVISASIIAIFLPVAFMRGMIGKFFFQFGVVVSVAVAFSLLEALTLTPMRCSRFLKVKHGNFITKGMDRLMHRLSELYKASLRVVLRFRFVTLLVALILFSGSLMLIPHIRKEAAPSQDISRMLVRIQTAPGSSIHFTDELFKVAEERLSKLPELDRYFAAIGGFGGGEVNTGVMYVTLKKPDQRPIDPKLGRRRTQNDVMDWVRENFKTIPNIYRVAIQDLSQQQMGGSSRSFPIDISLRGPDLDRLGNYADEFIKQMNATGFVMDLDTDFYVGVPEVRIFPDRKKADQRGVPVSIIADAIQASFGGIRAGKYTRDGRRYDIRVSFEDRYRRNKKNLSLVWVRNTRGEMIPLNEVTQVAEKPSLLTINREGRQRSVRIYGNIATGKSQSDALSSAQQIAKDILPEQYKMSFSGSSKGFMESFQELLFALLLGIGVAYMILAAQYNSFVDPFVILLALPFSLSGALIALWMYDQSLSTISLIGILLLMGLVKKNSILIVDFGNQKVAEGLDSLNAMVEAAPLRLRPILMTTFSTIAGALPAALNIGPGAAARAPMATVIIGGMLVSTLLSLYVVPSTYTILSKLKRT